MTNTIFPTKYPSTKLHLSSDRNLDLDTSLDVDDDLLDNFGRGVETMHISARRINEYTGLLTQ